MDVKGLTLLGQVLKKTGGKASDQGIFLSELKGYGRMESDALSEVRHYYQSFAPLIQDIH